MIHGRLFTLATVVSLLLFLATAALAVVNLDRSYSYVWLEPERARVEVAFLDRYCVGLFKNHTDYTPTRPDKHFRNMFMLELYQNGWHRGVPLITIPPSDNHELLGFSWGETRLTEIVNTTDTIDDVTFAAYVPLWAPLLVFAVLPAGYVGKIWHAKKRREQGYCASCGYDLRGNISDICPECGTPSAVSRG